MTRLYSRRFRGRHYEIDSRGRVNHAVYLTALQQLALEPSAGAG